MRVGTRIPSKLAVSVTEDHPHACGDKHIIPSLPLKEVGSSPCVWGQVTFKHFPFVNTRIIPMRVGTSKSWMKENITEKDHPHACGDKRLIMLNGSMARGSSPCVWGQVDTGIKILDTLRIIPMRVGTSCTKSDINKVSKDHPHACGDKEQGKRKRKPRIGSSPCVWGQELMKKLKLI